MVVYLINIFMIIMWSFIFNCESQEGKKKFCIIASLQWICLSGLRHISVGTDTLVYKVERFDHTMLLSWSEIFDDFVNVVFYGEEGKDPGYTILEKAVQVFSEEYRFFLFFIAVLFTASMGYLIYKYSKSPLLSFLIYSVLFYAFFAITGLRQTVATAMVVFVGYELILRKRFWTFLCIVLVCSTIHKSAFIFLPFYFIDRFQINKCTIAVCLIAFPIVFKLRNQVIQFLGEMSGYEEYTKQFDGAGTYTFTTLYVLLTLVAIWRFKYMDKSNNRRHHYLFSILSALVLTPLTFVDPSAMRVVQYFSIFMLFLVPEIVDSFHPQDRPFLTVGVVVVLVLLLIKTQPYYRFCWESI